MLSGIVAIFGALAGLVPGILQFLTVKANHAQQIALEQLRMQAAKEGTALQIDLAHANADTQQQQHIYSYAAAPSGIKWVDALAVFVRPYITLVMFHAWVALEALLLLYGVANGVELEKMATLLWDEEVQSLFAAIVGFWFGNRMLVRGNQQMAATMAVQPVSPGAANAIVERADTTRTVANRGIIPDPPGSRT